LTDGIVNVELEGGKLHINYDKENGIEMSGGAEITFEGRLDF